MGLQRIIRHTPRAEPFKTPWMRIASLKYSEQVGVKRQALGSNGEIKRL
jgi:hypothetical protein